ncbi:hypothetical protein Saa2_02205 [Streptomyces acidiscabies]|nr:hypothetical protein Saa2_02205 [Streptomyces acidiscabies]
MTHPMIHTHPMHNSCPTLGAPSPDGEAGPE